MSIIALSYYTALNFNKPDNKLFSRVQLQIIASLLVFCKVRISMLEMFFHTIMLAVFLSPGCSFLCNLIFSLDYTVFYKCIKQKLNYLFL
jgi:hypothetical protein